MRKNALGTVASRSSCENKKVKKSGQALQSDENVYNKERSKEETKQIVMEI